jgi:cerevisin
VPTSPISDLVWTFLVLVNDFFYFNVMVADFFIAGLNILSTYKGSKQATAVLSGTSMASPHTAGLLAYLLSIYPSPDFNPTFDEESNLISLHDQQSFDAYAALYASLPSWISNYMPSPRLVEALTAPIPGKTLTPLRLKKALVALASKGLLTELPTKDTVNLLIFNNATTA